MRTIILVQDGISGEATSPPVDHKPSKFMETMWSYKPLCPSVHFVADRSTQWPVVMVDSGIEQTDSVMGG